MFQQPVKHLNFKRSIRIFSRGCTLPFGSPPAGYERGKQRDESVESDTTGGGTTSGLPVRHHEVKVESRHKVRPSFCSRFDVSHLVRVKLSLEHVFDRSRRRTEKKCNLVTEGRRRGRCLGERGKEGTRGDRDTHTHTYV